MTQVLHKITDRFGKDVVVTIIDDQQTIKFDGFLNPFNCCDDFVIDINKLDPDNIIFKKPRHEIYRDHLIPIIITVHFGDIK